MTYDFGDRLFFHSKRKEYNCLNGMQVMVMKTTKVLHAFTGLKDVTVPISLIYNGIKVDALPTELFLEHK